jgi:hypothetical protein
LYGHGIGLVACRIVRPANQRDVPYQSPTKLWLAEKVEAGRDRAGSKD